MSRRIRKIDDIENPGHGFFAVEGLDGYFREADAKRIAAQPDPTPTAEATKPVGVKAVDVSADGSALCPSCGHRFAVKESEDEGEEPQQPHHTPPAAADQGPA